MRELKFRAWDKKENKFIEDWQDCIWVEYSGFNGGDSFEVMQYTGLKDSNGVEIFESDIVKGFIDGGECRWVVCFEEDRELNGWNVVPQNVEDGIEVIGNIHKGDKS